MKCIKVFLMGLIFFVLGFGVWAQDIDDEEEQQPEPAKIIEDKIILPIQPPKPKPTPIEIQPIEPKVESKQRFVPPSLVTPPERDSELEPAGQFWFKEPTLSPATPSEREQGTTPTSQFWFKQPTPVVAPNYLKGDQPQELRFQNPSLISAPAYLKEDQPQGIQFQGPGSINPPDYYKQIQSPGYQFQTPNPVNAPDYHNPYNPRGVSFIPFKQPSLLANAPPSPSADYRNQLMKFRTPRQVQGASSQYSMAILQDFRGGLNLVDFPNKIADNEATEQQNFIWSTAGKLEPRPGFDKYNTTEFDAGKRIWGLHPYYTSDGGKILLAGVNGTLWADTTYNGAGTFVSVKTGLQSNDKYYDFETFKGKAIVAHEGDYPFVLDEEMNKPFEFGYAEKFSGNSQTHIACTVYVEVLNVNWRTDQWAGYLLCDAPSTHATGAQTEPLMIFGNTNNVLLIPSQWASVGLDEANYIVGAFDYDSLWAGTTDSVDNSVVCVNYIRDDFTGADVGNGDGRVIKMTSGPSAGEERIITYNDLAQIRTQYRFDSLTLSGGDDFVILKKVFWQPELCEIYKNRLFFVTKNQYPQSSKEFIVFSEDNEPTYFDPDNFIPIGGGGDDKVTALATFYDDQLGYKDRSRDCLVIFKENSIYKLVWNSATDYYLVQVTEGIGCVAPQSVVNVEGKYILFLHTTGVYAFDGRTVTLVSKKIQPTIETIKGWPIKLAAGGYYKDHYYLSYPDGGYGRCNKTIVFNVKLVAWATVVGMRGNIYAEQTALSDTVKLLFSDWQDRTLIYEFGEATTDTGEAISLAYKSKAFDFNSIADRKRFTYFDLDYYLTSGNFTTYFYTDFGDSLRYNKTVSESGGYRYKRLPLDADCLGRNFSFKITSSSHLELGKVGLKFKKIGE